VISRRSFLGLISHNPREPDALFARPVSDSGRESEALNAGRVRNSEPAKSQRLMTITIDYRSCHQKWQLCRRCAEVVVGG
jgi:hypothetical protein